MAIKNLKQARRRKIRHRIRKKIIGTAERPRLIATKTNKRLYIQLIDDTKKVTLAGIAVKGKNTAAAIEAGKLIATKARDKKIETVVYDRAGYLYHGVIKTFSETARKEGLKH